MRYFFGTIGILAALCFVTYAAVTSYHTAASMTTQFPELAGWAAAGMVAWEALGALFVQQCWRNGSKWMAVGGAVLVLAASVYLLRIDLRFHVAGQSDMAAAREVTSENRELARSEHAKAIAQRDRLRAMNTITAYDRGEIAKAEKRIAELEPKLWTPDMVTAGGMPEAGWASRMLSGISSDKQQWTDLLMVVGLLFWALARMLALPVAVASMQMAAPKAPPRAKRDESDPRVMADEYHRMGVLELAEKTTPFKTAIQARTAAFDQEATKTPLELKQPPSVILDDLLPAPDQDNPDPADVAALRAAVEKFHAPKDDPTPPNGGSRIPGPQLVVDNEADVSRFFDAEPPTKAEARGSRKKKEISAKAGTGDVQVWASLYMKPTADPGEVVTSKEARDCYESWCKSRGFKAVHPKDLTRQLNVILGRSQGKGVRGPRNGKGTIFQGFFLVDHEQFEVKKRARA